MTRLDEQARVLDEWFALPESRRRHATDAVAFAFRLLRERPELFSGSKETSYQLILGWLLPYLNNASSAMPRRQ